MAGGGADEIAALLGEQARDRLRVVAPQRLAGEDHHAGVDVLGIDAGVAIGVADDRAQPRVVDALLALIGRQRDRRAEQRLARDHVVAAGQLLAQPAQVHLGEDHLRAGRADVDADAGQRDVVGDPERIVLDRPVVEIVVVVVGVAVVDMRQIGAEPVVGDGVGGDCLSDWSSGSAMTSAPYSKTGPRGSPFASIMSVQGHHFCALYQSSTSLRTWSLAMP